MKVTLHEVAARADVSIATVSRALNGLSVSKEARARVEKAVAELGYVVNEAARALRSDRTMTMGIVFYDLRNTLGIDLLDALSESIEDAGYSLLISTARGDAQRYDVLMHRFLERRVDALFCLRPRGKGESLARYQGADIPVIALFSAGGAYADLPLIAPSVAEGAKALAECLSELGHTRVAMLEREGASIAAGGVADALKTHGLQVTHADIGENGVRGALDEIMARLARPTAIIAPDPIVRGVLAACAEAGVSTPKDMSVVSVCDIASDAHHKKHGLAALMIDPHRMGRASGGAMLAWLAGSQPAGRVHIQAASFHARASLGPAPKRAR